jgi:hypothetical protein
MIRAFTVIFAGAILAENCENSPPETCREYVLDTMATVEKSSESYCLNNPLFKAWMNSHSKNHQTHKIIRMEDYAFRETFPDGLSLFKPGKTDFILAIITSKS